MYVCVCLYTWTGIHLQLKQYRCVEMCYLPLLLQNNLPKKRSKGHHDLI